MPTDSLWVSSWWRVKKLARALCSSFVLDLTCYHYCDSVEQLTLLSAKKKLLAVAVLQAQTPGKSKNEQFGNLV